MHLCLCCSPAWLLLPQDELPPQEQVPTGGVKGFLPYRPTATLLASALSGPPSMEVRV